MSRVNVRRVSKKASNKELSGRSKGFKRKKNESKLVRD